MVPCRRTRGPEALVDHRGFDYREGITVAKLLFVLVIIAVAMLSAFLVGFVVGTTVTPLSPAATQVAASVVIRD